MSDEALLRIKLEDGSTGGPAGAPAGTTAPPPPAWTPRLPRQAQPAGGGAASVVPGVDVNAQPFFDELLKVAEEFRGVIGGTFGRLIGALLDGMALFQKFRDAQIPAVVAAGSSAAASVTPTGTAPGATTAAASAANAAIPPQRVPARPRAPLIPPPIPGAPRVYGLVYGRAVPPPPLVGPPAPPPSGRAAAAAQQAIGGKGAWSPLAPNQPLTQGPASAAAAGAGGGLGAGLAAAAGPVAIGLAVMAALEKLKDALVGAVTAAGAFTTKFAASETTVGQVAEMAGTGLRAFGDKLFYASPLLGTFTSVLGESINVLGQFTAVVDGFVDRYAQFSPGLALGTGQAELVQVMGDFRRAQQVTPELLRYLQTRTEVQQRYEDVKARLLQQMAPTATKLLESVDRMLPTLEVVARIVQGDFEALARITEYLSRVLAFLTRSGDKSVEDFDLTKVGQIPGLGNTNFFAPGAGPQSEV
jgi:hypothetical protein